MGVPPLHAFYAGRILNALTGILLVALAMRTMPQYAWAFAIVGWTPMLLYLAGSFSADTVTTGIAFCTTAAALRLLKGEVSRKRWAGFIVLAFLLALAKPAYVLVPLLVLPLWRFRPARPFIATTLAAMTSGAAIAAWTARAGYFAMRPDLLANPQAQLRHMLGYPLRVASAVVSDYARHTTQYFDHFVGRLGWLDIGLPDSVELAYLLAFLYVALSSGAGFSPRVRMLVLSVFVASLVMVSVSQYMIWTPVGSSDVDGIQGRYFLPVSPLPLIALAVKRLPWRWWIPTGIALFRQWRRDRDAGPSLLLNERPQQRVDCERRLLHSLRVGAADRQPWRRLVAECVFEPAMHVVAHVLAVPQSVLHEGDLVAG